MIAYVFYYLIGAGIGLLIFAGISDHIQARDTEHNGNVEDRWRERQAQAAELFEAGAAGVRYYQNGGYRELDDAGLWEWHNLDEES